MSTTSTSSAPPKSDGIRDNVKEFVTLYYNTLGMEPGLYAIEFTSTHVNEVGFFEGEVGIKHMLSPNDSVLPQFKVDHLPASIHPSPCDALVVQVVGTILMGEDTRRFVQSFVLYESNDSYVIRRENFVLLMGGGSGKPVNRDPGLAYKSLAVNVPPISPSTTAPPPTSILNQLPILLPANPGVYSFPGVHSLPAVPSREVLVRPMNAVRASRRVNPYRDQDVHKYARSLCDTIISGAETIDYYIPPQPSPVRFALKSAIADIQLASREIKGLNSREPSAAATMPFAEGLNK